MPWWKARRGDCGTSWPAGASASPVAGCISRSSRPRWAHISSTSKGSTIILVSGIGSLPSSLMRRPSRSTPISPRRGCRWELRTSTGECWIRPGSHTPKRFAGPRGLPRPGFCRRRGWLRISMETCWARTGDTTSCSAWTGCGATTSESYSVSSAVLRRRSRSTSAQRNSSDPTSSRFRTGFTCFSRIWVVTRRPWNGPNSWKAHTTAWRSVCCTRCSLRTGIARIPSQHRSPTMCCRRHRS